MQACNLSFQSHIFEDIFSSSEKQTGIRNLLLKRVIIDNLDDLIFDINIETIDRVSSSPEGLFEESVMRCLEKSKVKVKKCFKESK